MSPEQAFGDAHLDGRGDVYALGCVAYEVVSGRTPFEAETPQALLAKQAAETVPSLRARDPAIPLFFERAVERAMAKSPDDRFQSASGFAEALTSEMVVARAGIRRWPRGVILAAAAGVMLVMAWVVSTVLGGPTYERLAVLPPTNLMNDPEQEGFIDGIHSALIAELQMAGIPVIARTSVMQFRDGETPIREIANELGAGAVVETRILRTGDSVEIGVSLVDGITQQYVGHPIVRRSHLRNVLSLYRDLTRAIATEVHATLTPQAEAHLGTARIVNPQAYEAYLNGLSQWHRGTDLDRALEYFQQALSLDPAYAPAHAGIALVWWWRGGTQAEARAAIERAMELDSTLAEVQYSLALIRTWHEWDWRGGEAAFRRAIEINPNHADARAFYAAFLYIMERPEEGRAQMDRALELDPFNLLSRAMNGRILCYYHRQYAEAIEQLEAILEIEPDHLVATRNLIEAYHLNRNYDEALALIRIQTDQMYPEDPELADALDRGYAEGGYRVALLRHAEALVARWERGERLDPLEVVRAYAMAGEKERTLDWLEIAYRGRSKNLPAHVPATGGGLLPYDDPRYQDLRRRMNLPTGVEGN